MEEPRWKISLAIASCVMVIAFNFCREFLHYEDDPALFTSVALGVLTIFAHRSGRFSKHKKIVDLQALTHF